MKKKINNGPQKYMSFVENFFQRETDLSGSKMIRKRTLLNDNN